MLFYILNIRFLSKTLPGSGTSVQKIYQFRTLFGIWNFGFEKGKNDESISIEFKNGKIRMVKKHNAEESRNREIRIIKIGRNYIYSKWITPFSRGIF